MARSPQNDYQVKMVAAADRVKPVSGSGVRGIARKTVGGYPPWEPGASHFGLAVPDAPVLWSQLQRRGWLRARSWDGPATPSRTGARPRQRPATAGARVISSGGGPVELKDGKRAVLLRDPDVGGFVELLEKP